MKALSFVALAFAAGCTSSISDDARTHEALSGPAAGVVNATTKIRPFDFNGATTAAASIDAAQNEFEAFQIAVAGGANGIAGVSATAGALTGPNGAQIAASNVRLYRVELYDVWYASSVEGAAGEWPDPLIPDVDAYDGQKRNAFPFNVAPNATRAIWVEVYVPKGTAPGVYTGSVSVAGAGFTASVPVSLRVRSFALPSTASLKSAFGFASDVACRAFNGTQFCNSNADAEPYVKKFAKAALDHRISLYSPYYTMPTNGDWSYFDGLDGPLLDGSAPTTLPGAKLTTFKSASENASFMAQEKSHFDAKGWSGRLFDYTCDEPPQTCAWSDIPNRASAVHAQGLRTLVTTDIDQASAHLGSWQSDIDILTPVVNFMDGASGNQRGRYDAFLAQGPTKELWWYQSCMSHGCGGCDPSNASQDVRGYPSYVIDSSAIQNRAMEWLSYEYGVNGELYWETLWSLNQAWDSYTHASDALCSFGGNGDGTFFYPGTPSKVGGSTPIPIETMRLKMVREGMEDYEYLHLLESLGDKTTAMSTAKALFPTSYRVTEATPDALYAARKKLADRIEQLMGGGPPPARQRVAVMRAHSAVNLSGDLSEFSAAPAVTISSGAASATFRMLWDPTYLYVAATVKDADLRYVGAGKDGGLWNADGVEIMLDPMRAFGAAPDANDRHVIATAHGDVYDATGAGASGDPSFDFAGLAPVAVVHGTFNDAAADSGYQIAMAIPWSGIPLKPGDTVATGLVLGADLALNDLDASGLSYGDWAQAIPYAQPAKWNELQLQDTGACGTP